MDKSHCVHCLGHQRHTKQAVCLLCSHPKMFSPIRTFSDAPPSIWQLNFVRVLFNSVCSGCQRHDLSGYWRNLAEFFSVRHQGRALLALRNKTCSNQPPWIEPRLDETTLVGNHRQLFFGEVKGSPKPRTRRLPPLNPRSCTIRFG